ncbi:MAG: peptidoglycan-binding protein [Solirubrobacterales bacterium]
MNQPPHTRDARRSARPAPRSPDRPALWAFVIGVFVAVLAATSAQAMTGGAAPPDTNPAPSEPTAPATPSPGGAELLVGRDLGARLLEPGVEGKDVRILQGALRAKRYGPPKLTNTYDASTRSAVSKFQVAADLESSGVTGPETIAALQNSMRTRTATWYGPGFYGRRTACGRTLRRSTIGVAHKTLPCNTVVTIAYGGKFLRAKVIDRGPYRRGTSWDLTNGAAKRLGFRGTGPIRTVHERPRPR